jgi:glycolate oxidase FAD binding subunit
MGKLMIGSFGTLAAIAVANFKLVPKTAYSRTFVLGFESLDEACRARDGILRGVLQPAAIDLLNPQASAIIGHSGHLLILQAGGNRAVIERYATELGSPRSLEGEEERTLWRKIENFTPDFLAGQPDGAVVRVSGTLSQIREMVSAVDGPAVARAGSGVCYAYFAACGQAAEWIKDTVQRGWKAVIEYAPPEKKERLDLWPSPGSDFEMMKRIKEMFDPGYLLNRGRLYGRL